MSRVFAVYGAGGHARVAVALLHSNGLSVYGAYDHNFRPDETILGVPVRGTPATMFKQQDRFDAVALAIGDNQQRREAFAMLAERQFELPALQHAKALIDGEATCGKASMVCIGGILGAKASIGKGAIINSGAIVDHESTVGDFSHLAPGVRVGGRARIGRNVFIGMGAVIAHSVSIGDNAVIGANSVILADVAREARIYGIHH
ncbi:MAG: NeuD/PglB/VioB family sugar acetyltransferase [Desulfovibrionaceae bacterium]|nr:NeuD/PglB/VioB family sugar acetyltransferase [Desulfovibrionaceae bacterium]